MSKSKHIVRFTPTEGGGVFGIWRDHDSGLLHAGGPIGTKDKALRLLGEGWESARRGNKFRAWKPGGRHEFTALLWRIHRAGIDPEPVTTFRRITY